VFFCGSAALFVFAAGAVVRGRTVWDEFVFWAKAIELAALKTMTAPIIDLLIMIYSS
jgi:hypothetical protein